MSILRVYNDQFALEQLRLDSRRTAITFDDHLSVSMLDGMRQSQVVVVCSLLERLNSQLPTICVSTGRPITKLSTLVEAGRESSLDRSVLIYNRLINSTSQDPLVAYLDATGGLLSIPLDSAYYAANQQRTRELILRNADINSQILITVFELSQDMVRVRHALERSPVENRITEINRQIGAITKIDTSLSDVISALKDINRETQAARKSLDEFRKKVDANAPRSEQAKAIAGYYRAVYRIVDIAIDIISSLGRREAVDPRLLEERERLQATLAQLQREAEADLRARQGRQLGALRALAEQRVEGAINRTSRGRIFESLIRRTIADYARDPARDIDRYRANVSSLLQFILQDEFQAFESGWEPGRCAYVESVAEGTISIVQGCLYWGPDDQERVVLGSPVGLDVGRVGVIPLLRLAPGIAGQQGVPVEGFVVTRVERVVPKLELGP